MLAVITIGKTTITRNTLQDLLTKRPAFRMLGGDYWATQVPQYAPTGTPGVSLFEPQEAPWVKCLLWRNKYGALQGILNYFPESYGVEKAGGFTLIVNPTYLGTGIGTALLQAAMERWEINLPAQDYSRDGLQFAQRFVLKALNGTLGLRPEA